MRLKSYFSGTVEAAIELARKELGEDALLMNARPSTPETRSLGAYEVVFGVSPKTPDAAEATQTAVSLSGGAGVDRLSQDVADMRREIARMAQTLQGARNIQGLAGSANGTASGDVPSSVIDSELYSRLIANELDPALAQAAAQGRSLEGTFEVDATIGRRGANRIVVALVGPPGVGKTTTLVKLAARYGLTSRRPAQILSADVYRIAAADQLRSLASILGIGCDVVETPVALAQALEEHHAKDVILIDTPGLARGEMEDGADLARLIASHPEMETHLVLSASMKPADLAAVIDRYECFQPNKLLFTRIDETERYGVLINEASRRALPISFLATGQQIPDDLEPATKERVIGLVMGTPGLALTRTLGATA